MPVTDHIMFRFDDVNLLPTYTGMDGKQYTYGDQTMAGTLCVKFDADGDWWISSIWLETSERNVPDPGKDYGDWVDREIFRYQPFYVFVKDAIERECRDAIQEAVNAQLNVRRRTKWQVFA